MGRFGFQELLLVLFILLLLFGAQKLPQIARSMGESIKEFKKTMNEKDKEEEKESKPEDKK